GHARRLGARVHHARTVLAVGAARARARAGALAGAVLAELARTAHHVGAGIGLALGRRAGADFALLAALRAPGAVEASARLADVAVGGRDRRARVDAGGLAVAVELADVARRAGQLGALVGDAELLGRLADVTARARELALAARRDAVALVALV